MGCPSGSRWARRVGGDDRGQAIVLAVLVLAAAVGAATLIVQVGAVAVDRARARTAADAAALAGAAEGSRDAAVRAAERNDAELEGYRIVDGQTEVTVRVGRARATSRAVVGPVRAPPGRDQGRVIVVPTQATSPVREAPNTPTHPLISPTAPRRATPASDSMAAAMPGAWG